MAIVLGANQYGKAEVRLLHVSRDGTSQDGAGQDGASQDGGTHEITDLNVSVALSGDLAAAHLTGDNSAVLTTDAQKNTVFAFAREHGVGQIEDFALLLARHFVASQEAISFARVTVEQYPWERLGGHSFRRSGREVRTATVSHDGRDSWVVSGLHELVVLNSAGSEFWGFARDRYTTLAETTDRILATAVDARWRHASASAPDWARVVAGGPGPAAGGVRRHAQLFAAADAVRHGTPGARGPAGNRRDPPVAAEQAPLRGRHVAVRDGRTEGRCSTPPTGRTG